MLPLWLKLVYLLFVAVLVPVYTLHHGVASFFWFSNLALVLGLVAVWLEHRRLASMMLVSVFLLDIGWQAAFVSGLVRGGDPVLGMTAYMFDPDIPLFVRVLSLYHIPLPYLLLWTAWRLGYDGTAWHLWIPAGWGVLVVTHWLTVPEHNINWVHGPPGLPNALPGWAWLPLLLAMAALFWWLSHKLVLVLLAWLGDERRHP